LVEQGHMRVEVDQRINRKLTRQSFLSVLRWWLNWI